MTDLPTLTIGCGKRIRPLYICKNKDLCSNCSKVRRVVLTRAAHWEKTKKESLQKGYELYYSGLRDEALEIGGIFQDDFFEWLREKVDTE